MLALMSLYGFVYNIQINVLSGRKLELLSIFNVTFAALLTLMFIFSQGTQQNDASNWNRNKYYIRLTTNKIYTTD